MGHLGDIRCPQPGHAALPLPTPVLVLGPGEQDDVGLRMVIRASPQCRISFRSTFKQMFHSERCLHMSPWLD